MRFRVEKSLPLAALTLLAACGGGAHVQDLPQAAGSGPAGDYPMVLGPSYSVDGETYSPSDTMNYDAVGRATIGSEGGAGITAAHHTLPLPSYVEVTALDTGKTILVRVERRGPMASRDAIELSPGAAAQLGVSPGSRPAVRVRRVNPIEPERAMLRAGQAAPARMDTPKSLLVVLQRKLDLQEGRTPSAVVDSAPPPAPAPVAAPTPAAKPGPAKPKPAPAPAKPKPQPAPAPAPAPKPAPAPVPAPAPAPVAAHGKFVVQVGAFSDHARAQSAAARIGGNLTQAGSVWRVRLGPYASEADAQAGLAKARAAGYSDARIQRAN